MNDLTPELIADIEEVFLGHWDDDVMAIARQPYSPHALSAYAQQEIRRTGAAQSDENDVHPAPCWFPYYKPCTCFDGLGVDGNAGGAR